MLTRYVLIAGSFQHCSVTDCLRTALTICFRLVGQGNSSLELVVHNTNLKQIMTTKIKNKITNERINQSINKQMYDESINQTMNKKYQINE